MVIINNENNAPRAQGAKNHDCSKCDKVPSAIKIRQSRDQKEYHGKLVLDEAVFCYRFRVAGSFNQSATDEEIEETVEFYFTDSKDKPIALTKTMDNYLRNLVTLAALSLAKDAQTSGVRQLTSMLEKAAGSTGIVAEIETAYSGCAPVSAEIRQFLSDYKARGQKA